MAQCNESCEHKARSDKRLAFMADRMALLMLELVRRDFDYGRFCHEEFFTDEVAGYLQQGKDYKICMDFVRMMIKKHDLREKEIEQARPEETQRGDAEATQEPDASAGGGLA